MTGTTQRTPQPALSAPPLSEPALHAAIVPASRLFTDVRVLERTGSTNADLLAAARAGAPAGSVLAAENQTSGRGRLDRRWQSQPGTALTFSVLLRPAGVPAANRGWLPLLAGVAVASALRSRTGLDVVLKWPNDVLCNGAKLAGILAEQAGDAIVVGVGLNVSSAEDELPTDQATSLLLQGASDLDRQDLLAAILREFEHWYLRFAAGPGAGRRREQRAPRRVLALLQHDRPRRARRVAGCRSPDRAGVRRGRRRAIADQRRRRCSRGQCRRRRARPATALVPC